MIKPDQYAPILKGKRGEFRALAALNDEVLDKTTPVVDIVIPPNNKTLSQHINTTNEYFVKYWKKEKLIYIDGYMIQEQGLLRGGIHPIQYIFDELLSDGFNILPVIDSSTSVEYNQVVKNIIIDHSLTPAMRIFRFPNVDINFEINRLLNLLEMSPSQVDLIIDLRSLEGTTIDNLYVWVAHHFSRLQFLSQWRSVVLSGSIFPINLSAIAPDQIYLLPRMEWLLWQRFVRDGVVDRIPSYSDYAISHPLILEYETDAINMSASIRYTGENDFYIYRGRGIKQYGSDQFYDLSEMLINRPEYCGHNHCYGDNHINQCAERIKKGNAESWRLVGTNHHLTKVTDQLRQFFLDFSV
ncbi:MAG: hypothetical protein B6D44_10205 [Ignavibacteriales bacterium UTCHB2]|jgi:hypothetical protein|nr:MAG: hypothetical protein B6D44_10205 [Ignavibacteriales bacterium UTCHB2]